MPPTVRDSVFNPTLLALYGVGGVLLFWGLGSGSLENSDGPLYAMYARQMLSSGNYLDTGWFGHQELLKPPGFIWLLCLSNVILGDGELACRFPSALSALLLLVVTAACARRLFPGKERAVAGAAAVCVLLASGLLYYNARKVQAELPLSLLLTVALYGLIRAGDGRRFLAIWGAALGLATLVKGIMVLLPLSAGLIFLLAFHRRRLLSRDGLAAGLLFAAISLPWFVIQAIRIPSFLQQYFVQNTLGRLSSTITGSGGEDPLLYLSGLWASDHLLGLAMVGAGVATCILAVVRRRQDDGQVRALALLGLSWLLLVVPIHLIATRLIYYLVPAIPVLALCLAGLLARLPARPIVRGLLVLVAAALFVLNNLVTLTSLDRSPGIKELAARAGRQADEVYTYDLYHTAAAYYANRRVTLLTESTAAHRMITAWPIFSGSRTVRLVNRAELLRPLSRRGAGILTIKPFLPRLRRIIGDRPGGAPGVQIFESKGIALIMVDR